jgi:nitrogen-specific signal transduction histidine kinase
MGLSCTHSIIKELGGNVSLLESKPGMTVFRIQMPVMQDKQYLENLLTNQEDKQKIYKDNL